jgi:hypothetical protein
MKRSRRVVLTLMGSAAIGAVSMGLVPRRDCGPGIEAVPGAGGRAYCRPVYRGFGGTPGRLHGHDGHGHGGHGHGGG